jgi:hypothetical protein
MLKENHFSRNQEKKILKVIPVISKHLHGPNAKEVSAIFKTIIDRWNEIGIGGAAEANVKEIKK